MNIDVPLRALGKSRPASIHNLPTSSRLPLKTWKLPLVPMSDHQAPRYEMEITLRKPQTQQMRMERKIFEHQVKYSCPRSGECQMYVGRRRYSYESKVRAIQQKPAQNHP